MAAGNFCPRKDVIMAIELHQKKCIPCEGYEKPLQAEQVARYLTQVDGWEVVANKKIRKNFKFKNFKEAMVFINQIANLAEEEQHHPDIYIFYNLVSIELHTHAISGLSENDFILASKIDKL